MSLFQPAINLATPGHLTLLAIRALHDRFPEHPIVADLRIMDGGGLETESRVFDFLGDVVAATSLPVQKVGGTRPPTLTP